MGDNNLFCVIFQKNGNGLEAIYHGQISGKGVSSVIDRSVNSGSSGAMVGNSLPDFNPEHFKNATFTDTGDITIDNKTFTNPFQNFDSSKLEGIDTSQFQGLITELTSAGTDKEKAKIGMKFATTIGKKVPGADQYMDLMTKFAGTEGAAKMAGTFAKATQPMVKIAVGMALKHHPYAKNLPTEVHDALTGFADNFSSVVANNAEDAVSILGEVAKESEAANSTTAVTSNAENKNTTREEAPVVPVGEDKSGQQEVPQEGQQVVPQEGQLEVPQDGQQEVPQEGQQVVPQEGQQVVPQDEDSMNPNPLKRQNADSKLETDTPSSVDTTTPTPKKNITSRLSNYWTGKSEGGRRTKRKSKHHRRRKNKSKNKKR